MSLIARRHSHVVVNFAAWTARTCVPHLPEIVFGAEFVDALFRNALSEPQIVSLGVALHAVLALKNRDVELVLRKAEPFRRGEQLPCVGDGIFLEVIAEAEVSEHLEKRVVAIGEADIFEVVMLAAGAHALLRGGGARVVALFESKENVLELVHPSIREQKSRVVSRNERGGMHLAVPLLDEEVQESAANLRACQHGKLNSKRWKQFSVLGSWRLAPNP